jgi:ubiquinone/menaquinone biosynthesis C-methylase UbiE
MVQEPKNLQLQRGPSTIGVRRHFSPEPSLLNNMNAGTYYREKLSATRLRRCYEIAPARIRQYLAAEIQFVTSQIQGSELVLELGCGYGRVMKEVSKSVCWMVGNDVSKVSLEFAQHYLEGSTNCDLCLMDASHMGFQSRTFDVVLCIQNGISAFKANTKKLLAESLRVTKDDGTILFSTYSPKIWDARLDWFRKQSNLDLIGEIDEEQTREGTIVCKDGFKATTVTTDQFTELAGEFEVITTVEEVDESSIFFKVTREK